MAKRRNKKETLKYNELRRRYDQLLQRHGILKKAININFKDQDAGEMMDTIVSLKIKTRSLEDENHKLRTTIAEIKRRLENGTEQEENGQAERD